MTVLDVWHFANNNLGLITALGGAAVFVALLWLKTHFFSRKEGKALTARIISLENSVSHLPTPSDVETLSDKLAEIERKQDVQGEKLNGISVAVERLEKQSDTLLIHLLGNDK